MINQIHTADCLSFMEDHTVQADLIVTSPPYPGQKGNEQTVEEWLFDFQRFLLALIYGGLKKNGVLVYNVFFKRTEDGWFDMRLFEDVSAHFRRAGFNMIDVYPWIKPNPPPNGPLSYCDVPGWELIFVATRAESTDDYYYRPFRKPYKPKSVRSNGEVYSSNKSNGIKPNPKGARQPNVFIASSSGDQNRPKAKGISFPISFPTRYIQQFSAPGMLVMDTYCGVGTTCRAAQRLRRPYIGIEIDPGEAEKARNWLAEPFNVPIVEFLVQ